MRKILPLLMAPLLSSFSMMVGSSLLTTITSLRLNSLGFDEVMIALVASSYYIGMLLGSLKVENFIARVGHTRAFATFIAFLSFSAITPPLLDQLLIWMVGRAFAGFALAGLYVVLESWILSVSHESHRGRFLALYIIALSFGAIAGQQLLNLGDAKSLIPFCLVCVALSISVLPFTFSKVKPPKLDTVSDLSILMVIKSSPIGFYGSLISGILVSSMFSIFPVVFQNNEFTMFEISQMIAMLNMGGFILNYPFGWLSDHRDPVKVLLGLVAMALIGACYLVFGSLEFDMSLLTAAFLFGGGAIIMNTISMGISCHAVSQGNMTKTAQVLVFAYCVGGLIGPLLGSVALKIDPKLGIFALNLLTLAGFLAYLIQKQRVSISITTNVPAQDQAA